MTGINASIASGTDSAPAPGGPSPAGPPNSDVPGQTDDCLFLDVVVPQQVYNNARALNASGIPSKGVPALLWIHGGGHVTGTKDNQGNPAGLMAESMLDQWGGIVYVQINNRLGLFGYPPSAKMTPTRPPMLVFSTRGWP